MSIGSMLENKPNFFFNCQENGVVIVPPTLPLGKHQLLYKGKKLRDGPQASKHRLLRED